jgi:hypothetical protein
MARISSYPLDATIQDKDAWIGSDSITRATKQYTAEAVAEYLNINAKISISGQMIFKFVDNATGTADFSGPADGSAMTAITTIQLSIVDKAAQNVVKFIEYLVGNNVLIGEQNNISTFGHFTIDSYTATAGSANLYTLNLTNIGGNGNITDKLLYDFAVFTLSSQGAPTFQFTQGAPATTWNIQHNLGKFPSITVIDTGNTVVNGEYTYTDNNNVVLNFSAAFAGKAYLN